MEGLGTNYDENDSEDTQLDEDLIPGDNDKPGPNQPITITGVPDCPDNLTRIPSHSGDGPSNLPVTSDPTTGHELT